MYCLLVWRARFDGPLTSFVFGPALAGLAGVCSLDDCLLLFFRVGGPAFASLFLYLPEAFEVGGPALAGRPAFLCNAFDVIL